MKWFQLAKAKVAGPTVPKIHPLLSAAGFKEIKSPIESLSDAFKNLGSAMTSTPGVDLASGPDMSAIYADHPDDSYTSIAYDYPIPSGGEPGQVLSVDEDGEPQWITLDLVAAATPAAEISLDQALEALSKHGVFFKHIQVSHQYSHDVFPEIELNMVIQPDPKQAPEVIKTLHEWVAKKSPWGKY